MDHIIDVKDLWASVSGVWQTVDQLVAVLALGTFLLTVLLLPLLWVTRRIGRKKEKTSVQVDAHLAEDKGEGTMSKKERDMEINAVVSDHITAAIDDLVDRGALTVDEARMVYKKLARGTGLFDLMPRRYLGPRPLPGEIKDAIRHRMANGINRPCPLPDPREKSNDEKLRDLLRGLPNSH